MRWCVGDAEMETVAARMAMSVMGFVYMFDGFGLVWFVDR